MDTEDLRYRDIVAQLALFNMLKVNLSCCPDIYRTLLAVLCDFDPNQPDSKQKTSQYIRLLISDKLLADCIIVSLPQGDQERLEMETKTDILPLKQNVLANQECSNIERRTGLWLRQQAQTMKDVDVCEEPKTCKSITIIVSGRSDSMDGKDVCEDRSVAVPGKPVRPLALYPVDVSASHSRKQLNNNIHGDSQQYSDQKSCRDTDVSTRTPVSSKISTTEGPKSSMSWSSSIKQMITAMSVRPDYSKQTDSLKSIRPKLVLPELEYQAALGYKPSSSVATVYPPDRSHCYNPQIQVWRNSTNTAENNTIAGTATARNDLEVCSEVKRYSSTTLDEEPAVKVRKLSLSVDQGVSNVDQGVSNTNTGSAGKHPDRMQCFEELVEPSGLVTLSKTDDKAASDRHQKMALRLNDLLSKLPIQSNQVSDSGRENIVKDKNSDSRNNVGSSWQDREVRTPSLSQSETSVTKSTTQQAVSMPVSNVPSTACTMTKQYHLSYPIKMSINTETSKNTSYAYEACSQPINMSSSSKYYSCSSDICPESANYSSSVCNTGTYCYGLTGATKAFPYRQQIHLSNVLDFSTGCIVNDPPVECKTETIQVEAEQRRIRDSSQVNTFTPSLDLFRSASETQVSERMTGTTDSLLNNPRSIPLKAEPHVKNLKHGSESRLSTSSLGKIDESKDTNSGKQTFLIIETKTSNGSDQVQIKLNPQNSGNLLGELLKLKPGLVLKQGGGVETNNSDNAAKEIVPAEETSDQQGESEQDTVTNDSFVQVDDKSSLSDISGVCTDSEEFQCSDDQYDFSDQSDVVPVQIDSCPGEPKLVAFPLLNTNVFQQNLQQSGNDGANRVQPVTTPKRYHEPYSNINTPILNLPGSMTAALTDNVRLDALSSVQTGGGDNSNQFRFSSCGMSPYLLGLIPDMTSSTYDDNLSLEGSDDVFLNEYITPNMVKSRSTDLESETIEQDENDK